MHIFVLLLVLHIRTLIKPITKTLLKLKKMGCNGYISCQNINILMKFLDSTIQTIRNQSSNTHRNITLVSNKIKNQTTNDR